MKIVIIEDERLTANDLEATILQYDPTFDVSAKLLSVKDAVQYFNNDGEADLIFSDIKLGDGLSFDVFKRTGIRIPVIFCTAYDEYALDAFNTNGIAYLLKPFSLSTVRAALEKFKMLTQNDSKKNALQLETIMGLFESRRQDTSTSILVPYKDKIIPIKVQEVAVFFVENEVVHMITFDQKVYFPNKNLEELERIGGTNFYRANRQYLINRNAIVDVSNQLGRKLWVNLSVPLNESVTISREKVGVFLKWLSGG